MCSLVVLGCGGVSEVDLPRDSRTGVPRGLDPEFAAVGGTSSVIVFQAGGEQLLIGSDLVSGPPSGPGDSFRHRRCTWCPREIGQFRIRA